MIAVGFFMLWQPKRLELWQNTKTFLICNKNLFYTLLYQLSYRRNHPPGRTRTCDPRLHRQ
ncbi:hypothetical protein [Enterococcus phage PEF1]